MASLDGGTDGGVAAAAAAVAGKERGAAAADASRGQVGRQPQQEEASKGNSLLLIEDC